MIRDTIIYAYLCGFVERLQSEAFGRTHETNQDWNVAYDRGRALAVTLAEWPRRQRRLAARVEDRVARIAPNPTAQQIGN